ncbi:MAG: helix-turn-helix transcriptional regulator [Planctomycetes bacterium]|nr:helix-turn-helix transcriptional regulator [Planctomycetota bacterium]
MRHFMRLLALALRIGPRAVRVANEPGTLESGPGAHTVQVPRMSICLSGRSGYRVKRDGAAAECWLRPGQAIFLLPHCLSTPLPPARYESLGLVFHPGFVQCLHARQRRSGGHRILVAYALPSGGNEELAAWVQVLSRAAKRTNAGERLLRCALEGLLLRVQDLLRDPPRPSEGKAALAYAAASQFVREHAHEGIGRSDLARLLDLHPNHVSRLFRSQGQTTLQDALHAARLERARALLRDPQRSVKEVARASGFTTAAHFVAVYRRRFGQPPGRHRSAPE